MAPTRGRVVNIPEFMQLSPGSKVLRNFAMRTRVLGALALLVALTFAFGGRVRPAYHHVGVRRHVWRDERRFAAHGTTMHRPATMTTTLRLPTTTRTRKAYGVIRPRVCLIVAERRSGRVDYLLHLGRREELLRGLERGVGAPAGGLPDESRPSQPGSRMPRHEFVAR